MKKGFDIRNLTNKEIQNTRNLPEIIKVIVDNLDLDAKQQEQIDDLEKRVKKLEAKKSTKKESK